MSALGARTVCKIVESAGHDAVLMDFPMMAKKAKPVVRPPSLKYLDPFTIEETGPVSFFTGYKRLGPEPSRCARLISDADPDLLLISCFAYAYGEDTVALAKAVREMMPRLAIVAGGAGPTVLPEFFLRSRAVSFVLVGEAETNLLRLLSEFEKPDPNYDSVPGLHYAENDRVLSPSPARETTAEELEWVSAGVVGRSNRRRLSTSLSRGCPRLCAFCSNHLCHGRKFRKVPLRKVVRGIDLVATGISATRETAVAHFNLEDDNLLAAPEYTLAVMEYVKRKLDAPAITAENGVDSGFLTSPILEKLLGSGLSRLNLSLASVAPRVLAGVHRDEAGTRIASLTSQAAERGIPSVTYFICGLPGDSVQTIAANLLFISSLETTIGISLFYPTPGIEGFEDRSVFLESSPVLCCSSSAYPWTKTVSTRSLVTAFRLARFINLLKDPVQRRAHAGLISSTLADKRLYTWRKEGGTRRIAPVPHMDHDLVRTVVSQLDVDMLPARP